MPKGYFEAGLKLAFPLLFRDLTHHLQLATNEFYVNTVRLIMSMVVLDHIKGLQITTKDVISIHHAKRSRIPYEYYLSPRSGMCGFTTGGPIMNKEVN